MFRSEIYRVTDDIKRLADRLVWESSREAAVTLVHLQRMFKDGGEVDVLLRKLEEQQGV